MCSLYTTQCTNTMYIIHYPLYTGVAVYTVQSTSCTLYIIQFICNATKTADTSCTVGRYLTERRHLTELFIKG